MNDLPNDFELLAQAIAPFWVAAALVFLRVGGMIALLPALGDMLLPLRVRLAVLVAMTIIIAPALAMQNAAVQNLDLQIELLLFEPIIGLMLGFSLRLLILALQIAGSIAAQSISLSQLFSGTAAEPQPMISTLLVMAATALFVMMGGLHHAVALVLHSYQLIGPGSLPNAGEMALWAHRQGSDMIAQGFVFASPFLLAGLLYNLALGVINRAMPALMVMFIGAPALTWGGLILLALVAPLILQQWQALLAQSLSQPLRQ